MMPEARACLNIDALPEQAGWRMPAPEVIAQEIVEDLQAALEQFRLVAGDRVAEATEAS